MSTRIDAPRTAEGETLMATLTYNRAGKVLRFDLSDNEVAIIDSVIASPKGSTSIENAINEFFRQHHQNRRDKDDEQIKEKLKTLTDAQRQAILTILNS